MRILKIYIENFGCLHQYTKEFDQNLTIIEEDNGFGKTTLANFIKAMFYGFSGQKKSINENDRLKYAPWQGGIFGGNLEFELNNKKYRIERFFNPTGSTGDTFKLIDLSTNKTSRDFSRNIGEEIFGVDVDGYIRSSYLPQSNIEWSNQKINENLTNMLQSSTDGADVAEALKKLEAEVKKYVKVGNKGLIPETNAKIAKYEEEIEIAELSKDDAKKLKDNLANIVATLEKYNKRLSIVKEEIKKANEQHKKEAILNHYQSLSQNKEKLKREIDQLNEFFKDKIPSKEEISYNYTLLEDLSIVQSKLNKLVGNDYIESEYHRLKNYFSVEQEINDEIIKEKFRENEELKRISIERENISKEMEQAENTLANGTVLTQKHKMIYILLFFFGLVLGIPGIVLLASLFKEFVVTTLIAGILLTIVGFIFGTISLVILITRANQNNQKLTKYKKLEEECNSNIKDLSGRFVALEEKCAVLNKTIKDFVTKYEKVNDSLINRLKSDEDYLIELNSINNSYKTYIKLQVEYENRIKQREIVQDEYLQIKNNLEQFTKYYSPKEEPFQALRKIQLNSVQYESLTIRYQNACKELEDFLNNNEVDQKQTDQIYNLHELEKEEMDLEKKIENLINEKYATENKILNDEIKIDNLSDLESQLGLEKSLLEEYKHRHYVLTKTIEFLKASQDKISSSYLGTMQKNFEKYISQVYTNGLNFELNSNLEISGSAYGSSKSLQFYSSGSQDIITFCARLALVDSLFKTVKPTIILDDPFTNLDKDNLSVATDFVRKLNKEFQIIYLICHESRKL